MMNNSGGWMNRWMGPEMWVWVVLGALMVVLLAVAAIRLSKK